MELQPLFAWNYLSRSSLVIHGINNVATLEAIACRDALFLAEDLMLHSFIVASDLQVVVKDIQNGSNASYCNIVIEISNRALMFNCTFTYEL